MICFAAETIFQFHSFFYRSVISGSVTWLVAVAIPLHSGRYGTDASRHLEAVFSRPYLVRCTVALMLQCCVRLSSVVVCDVMYRG